MTTSTRMLQLLDLLQTHRYWPGTDLADRLEVSPRTLRRDVERLRDLGYDVDAVRGVSGGYQLRAGNALPPLLMTDDEAVAIAIGLRASAATAVEGDNETSLSALTKIIGLMPPALRRRMDAVSTQTIASPRYGPTVDATALTTLAQGCRDSEVVEFAYVARSGDDTARRVEPHRLVSLGQRWYLVGYDRLRHDWRSFRVDRMSEVHLDGSRFRPRDLPAEDALAFVRAGIRTMPRSYDVRVRVAASAAAVSAHAGRWAQVTADGDEACVLTMQTDSLDWPVMLLAGLGVDFEVLSPDELSTFVTDVATRFGRATTAP